ncbi:MAG TPA: hypothetical protein VJL87_04905 [Bdellovibrionota bacterium]|nr:hypothetical protein [Bdellovibrionota bacterium]
MGQTPVNLTEDRNALEIIFQKHFYSSKGISTVELTKLVATEYLEYLILKRGAFVPERFRNTVLQELMIEVKDMVKTKIDGFPSISAYLEKHEPELQPIRDEFEKKYYDLF